MDAPKRWAPWWAILLTGISLLVPLGVLLLGVNELVHGMSERYMSELSEFIAPIILTLGLFLLVPGVLYLVLRTKLLFVTAMVVTGGVLLVPGLVQFF